MFNDPELNPKYIGKITEDFVKISDNLKEASYQIRSRGFSDYPIFPISKIPIPIGSLLFEQGNFDITFNYYASYLDEFVQREIINKDKIQAFQESYKDPEEFCCLFVVDEDFTNFVYIPYPID